MMVLPGDAITLLPTRRSFLFAPDGGFFLNWVFYLGVGEVETREWHRKWIFNLNSFDKFSSRREFFGRLSRKVAEVDVEKHD